MRTWRDTAEWIYPEALIPGAEEPITDVSDLYQRLAKEVVKAKINLGFVASIDHKDTLEVLTQEDYGSAQESAVAELVYRVGYRAQLKDSQIVDADVRRPELSRLALAVNEIRREMEYDRG